MSWIHRLIFFHPKRHPKGMGSSEIEQFLSWLAVRRRVSASTQNQALSALLFLYRRVRQTDLGTLPTVVGARTPERLPVVLSRPEVAAQFKQLAGTMRLIALLLYGAGFRVGECLALRTKDLDFDRDQIVVRQGKGHKDRATMLPLAAKTALTEHLAKVRQLHQRDLARGFGRAVLPYGLEYKYPNAATDWRWQFVFPAGRICRNPPFGPPTRFHLHESVVQKTVASTTLAAGLTKRVSPHTLRHSLATHLLAVRGETPRRTENGDGPG